MISQVQVEHLPQFSHLRKHVVFAEFTGRAGRCARVIEPAGARLLASRARRDRELPDSTAKPTSADRQLRVISIADWSLGKAMTHLPSARDLLAVTQPSIVASCD